jgi:hypothetical protein
MKNQGQQKRKKAVVKITILSALIYVLSSQAHAGVLSILSIPLGWIEWLLCMIFNLVFSFVGYCVDFIALLLKWEALSRPVFSDPIYVALTGIILELIIPLIVLAIVYTAIKLIFVSASPGERAAAKGELHQLLIALLLMPFSPALYQILINISYALTIILLGGTFSEYNLIINPLDSVYADVVGEGDNVPLFGTLVLMTFIKNCDMSLFCLYVCTCILALLAVVMVFTRVVVVLVLSVLMPLTVFLYSFSFTKPVGRKFLKWSVAWAFVPPLMAVFMIIAAVLLSSTSVESSSPDVGTGIGLATAFLTLMILTPLILTGALEATGNALTGLGQMTGGAKGAAMTAAGQMMQAKSAEGLVMAGMQAGAQAMTAGGKGAMGGIKKLISGGGSGGGGVGGAASAAGGAVKAGSKAAGAGAKAGGEGLSAGGKALSATVVGAPVGTTMWAVGGAMKDGGAAIEKIGGVAGSLMQKAGKVIEKAEKFKNKVTSGRSLVGKAARASKAGWKVAKKAKEGFDKAKPGLKAGGSVMKAGTMGTLKDGEQQQQSLAGFGQQAVLAGKGKGTGLGKKLANTRAGKALGGFKKKAARPFRDIKAKQLRYQRDKSKFNVAKADFNKAKRDYHSATPPEAKKAADGRMNAALGRMEKAKTANRKYRSSRIPQALGLSMGTPSKREGVLGKARRAGAKVWTGQYRTPPASAPPAGQGAKGFSLKNLRPSLGLRDYIKTGAMLGAGKAALGVAGIAGMGASTLVGLGIGAYIAAKVMDKTGATKAIKDAGEKTNVGRGFREGFKTAGAHELGEKAAKISRMNDSARHGHSLGFAMGLAANAGMSIAGAGLRLGLVTMPQMAMTAMMTGGLSIPFAGAKALWKAPGKVRAGANIIKNINRGRAGQSEIRAGEAGASTRAGGMRPDGGSLASVHGSKTAEKLNKAGIKDNHELTSASTADLRQAGFNDRQINDMHHKSAAAIKNDNPEFTDLAHDTGMTKQAAEQAQKTGNWNATDMLNNPSGALEASQEASRDAARQGLFKSQGSDFEGKFSKMPEKQQDKALERYMGDNVKSNVGAYDRAKQELETDTGTAGNLYRTAMSQGEDGKGMADRLVQKRMEDKLSPTALEARVNARQQLVNEKGPEFSGKSVGEQEQMTEAKLRDNIQGVGAGNAHTLAAGINPANLDNILTQSRASLGIAAGAALATSSTQSREDKAVEAGQKTRDDSSTHRESAGQDKKREYRESEHKWNEFKDNLTAGRGQRPSKGSGEQLEEMLEDRDERPNQ